MDMGSAAIDSQGDINAAYSQDLTRSAIAFSTICPFLVAARVLGRIKLHQQLGVDDVVIILAVCFSVALCVTMALLAKLGIGKANDVIEPLVLEKIIKLFLASQAVYKITTALTKASILLLYLRVFTQTLFRRVCWSLIGIIALDAMISVAFTVFQCRPVHRAWDFDIEGTCIDLMSVWLVNGAYSILSDIVVLILPLPMIYALQLPRNVKIGLMVVFSLGLFVCVTSVLRLIAMIESDRYCHPSWKGLPFSLWSLIEANAAIICAFMPTLKVIVTKFFSGIYDSFVRVESKSSSPRRYSSVATSTAYVESPQSSFFCDKPRAAY